MKVIFYIYKGNLIAVCPEEREDGKMPIFDGEKWNLVSPGSITKAKWATPEQYEGMLKELRRNRDLEPIAPIFKTDLIRFLESSPEIKARSLGKVSGYANGEMLYQYLRKPAENGELINISILHHCLPSLKKYGFYDILTNKLY